LWYFGIFPPCFGILDQEKSGNPDHKDGMRQPDIALQTLALSSWGISDYIEIKQNALKLLDVL
jgi:hypothetical protein